MRNIRFIVVAVAACWAIAAGAASNEYPSKPVRFISPFSPGGGTDTVARALALRLGDALVLGMPTRDVVVFTASLEEDKIEKLRETVETVERHQGRPVSRKLYQWTPQGWIEF